MITYCNRNVLVPNKNGIIRNNWDGEKNQPFSVNSRQKYLSFINYFMACQNSNLCRFATPH